MSVYEVSVEHAFPARHFLRRPDGGAEPSHEHLWRVTAAFRSDRLDEPTGVVVDFVDARRALEAIAADLAGSDLNQLAEFSARSPSAERLAEYLAGRLGREWSEGGKKLHRLAVTEAPGCSAVFYPGDRPC